MVASIKKNEYTEWTNAFNKRATDRKSKKLPNAIFWNKNKLSKLLAEFRRDKDIAHDYYVNFLKLGEEKYSNLAKLASEYIQIEFIDHIQHQTNKVEKQISWLWNWFFFLVGIAVSALIQKSFDSNNSEAAKKLLSNLKSDIITVDTLYQKQIYNSLLTRIDSLEKHIYNSHKK